MLSPHCKLTVIERCNGNYNLLVGLPRGSLKEKITTQCEQTPWGRSWCCQNFKRSRRHAAASCFLPCRGMKEAKSLLGQHACCTYRLQCWRPEGEWNPGSHL